MKLSEMTTEQIGKMQYITFKRMYDYENGTDYAKRHIEKYAFRNESSSIDTQTHVTHETETIDVQRIETNNGLQRDIIGNYNDNRVMIKKTLNHLNAMKRALTLSQSNDEITKLKNENIMYRELLNLELSIRTMNKNIFDENK